MPRTAQPRVKASDAYPDSPIPDIPVAGFRADWVHMLLGNYDLCKTDAQRGGFLSALYVLRMESLPPAYVRSSDIQEFQRGVNVVISMIEEAERLSR